MGRVVVCGSLNMDVVVQSERLPARGETLLGATVTLLPGGKGLNQAVAAARLGAPTTMLGAVGNDLFGDSLRLFLDENRIDAMGVKSVGNRNTGVALVQIVDGTNAITVASGANRSVARVAGRPNPRRTDVWVAQFETPIATTQGLFRRAKAAGARTVLNMAPFLPFTAGLLKCVDVAVLNEIELAQATGMKLRATSAKRTIVEACQHLRAKGARTVIATLGPRGAMVVTAEAATMVPGLAAEVVDTTGAGDCFVGALAARLAAGAAPLEAAHYAVVAATCAVERLGAAPAMPRAKEVAARLASA